MTLKYLSLYTNEEKTELKGVAFLPEKEDPLSFIKDYKGRTVGFESIFSGSYKAQNPAEVKSIDADIMLTNYSNIYRVRFDTKVPLEFKFLEYFGEMDEIELSNDKKGVAIEEVFFSIFSKKGKNLLH